MNHEQLFSRIERPWRAFAESYTGLPLSAMLQPGVVDDWSVQDLIAHVAIWENEALRALPLVLEKRRPPRYGGIDRFNAAQIASKKGDSLARALAEFEGTHRRLMAYLETVPESSFTQETRFRHRLRLDTYGHYPEHTEAILSWRKARGL